VNATVHPLTGDPHQAVLALLPWYATGRLDGDEALEVERHLTTCEECRAELAWETRMAQAHSTTHAVADAERGLADLHRRILADSDRPHPRTAAARHRRPPPSGWLRWALGAQSAIILVMTAWWALSAATNADFHAMGRPPSSAAAGNAIVRFHPQATEQQIRGALQAAGARLVDGPTVTGAYVLSMPALHQAAALAALRGRPIVLLAESLDPGPGP